MTLGQAGKTKEQKRDWKNRKQVENGSKSNGVNSY